MVDTGPDPGDFSPDSRWLVYSLLLKNHLSAIFVYNLESGLARQITDKSGGVLHLRRNSTGMHGVEI
jgi:Tol biopolymer transport system component